MMIAVDRYILIVKPLNRRMSPPVAVGVVVAVAVLATGAALPIALYANLSVVDDASLRLHRVYCIEHWPSLLGRQLYAVLSLVGQFVVPLTVIVVLYYRIFEGLRARAAAAAANSTSSKLIVIEDRASVQSKTEDFDAVVNKYLRPCYTQLHLWLFEYLAC